MPDLTGLQNATSYRVRIKEGHSAAGLLVSATGKRCIPSTQYRYGSGKWVSRLHWKRFKTNSSAARPGLLVGARYFVNHPHLLTYSLLFRSLLSLAHNERSRDGSCSNTRRSSRGKPGRAGPILSSARLGSPRCPYPQALVLPFPPASQTARDYK